MGQVFISLYPNLCPIPLMQVIFIVGEIDQSGFINP